jgi:hypothetical protein
LADVFGLEELLQAEGDRAELMATVETAVLDYLSAEIAVMGAQKLMSHNALVSKQEASDHPVASSELDGLQMLVRKEKTQPTSWSKNFPLPASPSIAN